MASAPTDPLRLEAARAAAPPAGKSRAVRRFFANRMAVAGLVVALLLCLTAVFANVLAPYHPTEDIFRGMRGVGPSAEHPLGFDHLGRDLLSRVIHGSRVALLVGILSSSTRSWPFRSSRSSSFLPPSWARASRPPSS